MDTKNVISPKNSEEVHITYRNNGVALKCITVNGEKIDGNILSSGEGITYDILVVTE